VRALRFGPRIREAPRPSRVLAISSRPFGSFVILLGAARAIVGLRPSFSVQLRYGESGAPVDSRRPRYDVESFGTKGRAYSAFRADWFVTVFCVW
jgi:hypothetical protein